MPHHAERLIDALQRLKGSGTFVASGTVDFVLPGLHIDGFGEIGFPVHESTAQALVAQAERAAFGKGSDTIVDEQVRRTHEIDASRLRFRNPAWQPLLQRILDRLKPELGIDGYQIEAQPYKLLIYQPGDFFLPHKDSEKETGMFGTLIIELPAAYSGGELVLRFDGREESVSFAAAGNHYQLGYAAFYADCEHEIKPVLSGYRISIVYNLVQRGHGAAVRAKPTGSAVDSLKSLIREHQQADEAKPLIVLLGHQYTPGSFSADALKLHDRIKAAALAEAASQLGYYARLCLVSSFVEGSPDGRTDHDGTEEDLQMGEVYTDGLSIEHWAANGQPHLNNISFDAGDLIAGFRLNEGEPLIKESSGYMGNYGPDLTFWYHYGAMMIWSPKLHVRLLAQQETETQLDWIDYFTKHRDLVSAAELDAARYLMATGFGDYRSNRSANMNRVAAWIMTENDRDFFKRIAPGIAQSYLSRIDTRHWLQLIAFLGEDESIAVFGNMLEDGNPLVLERLLDLLLAVKAANLAPELLRQQADALPESLAQALSRPSDTLSAAGVRALLMLTAGHRLPAARTYEIAHLLTRHADRKYIHHVLVPVLQESELDAPLTTALRNWCRETLREMTAVKPAAPADWRLDVPAALHAAAASRPELRDFLASPTETVFNVRADQEQARELEAAIGSSSMGLRTDIIRKGNSHTLRITKTQASFERALQHWQEDRLLLAGLPL